MGLLALVRQALRVLGPLVRLVGVLLAGERRLLELQNKIEQKFECTSLANSEFVDFNYFSPQFEMIALHYKFYFTKDGGFLKSMKILLRCPSLLA